MSPVTQSRPRRARPPKTSRPLRGRGVTWKQLRELAGGAHEFIVMCLSVEDANRVHAILYPHLPYPSIERAGGTLRARKAARR